MNRASSTLPSAIRCLHCSHWHSVYLQPTPGELQTVMAELKTLRHKMASKLQLAELIAQITGQDAAARARR